MIIISPASLVPKAIADYAPGAAIRFSDSGAEIGDVPCTDMTLPMDVTCNDHIKRVLNELLSVAQNHDWSKPLLITCKLGISRSPAAAFIIACAKDPARSEEEIAKAIREASPCCDINLLLTATADEILDRDGRMLDALDDMGSPHGGCLGQIAILH